MLPEHGKLVRDLIPDIIRRDGGVPVVVVLDDDGDYWTALLAKMHEEIDEVDGATQAQQLAELADVFEVLKTLTEVAGFTLGEVKQYADSKRTERGGFANRLWLIT